MTRTDATSDSFRTRAHSSTVEPVVKTSSTRMRWLPDTVRLCRTRKPSRKCGTPMLDNARGLLSKNGGMTDRSRLASKTGGMNDLTFSVAARLRAGFLPLFVCMVAFATIARGADDPYSSQGGNGPLGFGFSLSGLSAISRTGATVAQDGFKGGIAFNANDRFALYGQRLIAIAGADGADGTEYRLEFDPTSGIRSSGGEAAARTAGRSRPRAAAPSISASPPIPASSPKAAPPPSSGP